jgi:hypothetical protein
MAGPEVRNLGSSGRSLFFSAKPAAAIARSCPLFFLPCRQRTHTTQCVRACACVWLFAPWICAGWRPCLLHHAGTHRTQSARGRTCASSPAAARRKRSGPARIAQVHQSARWCYCSATATATATHCTPGVPGVPVPHLLRDPELNGGIRRFVS